MKLHRVNALLIRHLYLYKRSFPRILDLFYWPIMEILVWGFISIFIERMNISGFNAISFLLGAVIFWDLLNQSQKAVSIAFLEEVWERNLLNIFVAPLRVSEFVTATALVGFVRIILVTAVMSALAFLFYHFNLFLFGFALIPFIFNLFIFGLTLGLFTISIILRYGSSAQILAWGFIVLIQPFSAVFYPVSVLPDALLYVAYLFPSTYVFEGMRSVLSSGTLVQSYIFYAFLLNFLYFGLSLWFFYKMFARVKKEGRLLKMD